MSDDDSCGIIVSIPKDAKFMPSPPGVIPRQLPPMVKHAANNRRYGDVSAKNRSYGDVSANNRSYGDGSSNNRSYGDVSANNMSYGDVSANNRSYGDVSSNKRSYGDVPAINDHPYKIFQSGKPKCLLERRKQSSSYNNRPLSSLGIRKSFPSPNSNFVAFSLRNNEQYTHEDILDLIKHETGVNPISVQYDPGRFRVGSPNMSSRWIVELGCSAETQFLMQKGFEIHGEKVFGKPLDTCSAPKIEFEAFRRNMKEEKSEAIVHFQRKPGWFHDLVRRADMNEL